MILLVFKFTHTRNYIKYGMETNDDLSINLHFYFLFINIYPPGKF